MAASTLRITEVSEGGSVPFLRAENVGPQARPDPGRGGTCRWEAEPDRQRQHHHPPGRGIDIPVSCMEGQVELQPAGLPGGRGGVPGQVAGGAGERRGQAWMRKEATAATRARSGVKWSYSLRETQAPSPTSRTTGKGARRSPHQIDSFVERSSWWTGRSAPFSSARAASSVWNWGEEDLFKRCLPKIIRSFAFEVLNGRGSRAACPKTWRGGRHAGGPRFEAISRPGRAMTLRIDTGEVIGSGLYWNHSLAHLSCFPGAGPGTPSERPGPRRAPAASAAAPDARRGAAGNRMRPHDEWRLWPYLHGALTLPASGASGQRATPPAAIGPATGPGNCSPPLGGLFLGPVSRAGTAVEVPASRGKLSEGAGPENSSATPSAGCSSTPVSRVGAAVHACRGKLWTQSVRERFATPRRAVPSGSAWMSNSPPAVLGLTHPIRYPTASLISIGRAAGADPPRGLAMPGPARRFEQWRVQYSGSGEFGTPSCNAAGGTVNLIG